MNFLYNNSNLSGIGDRLFDLILVYTYSKYLNYDKLYLSWKINNNDMIYNDNPYAIARKEKTRFREKDYLLENLLNYLIFPDDIIFVTQEELNGMNNDNNYCFDEYMGLRYSVFTFIDKFLSNIDNNEKQIFINMYYENFKKITFKNIPSEIINYFKNNEIITIHLRRGDKVINDNGVSNNIENKDLIELNTITENFINKCISLNYKNICFVSDEQIVKQEFIQKFKDKCNIIDFKGDEISQTYYDIYCLTHSIINFLSQKFSVFSILSSMIGGVKLYYVYEHGKIIDDKFKYYYNIDNYKNFYTFLHSPLRYNANRKGQRI
jgi:hypothetical protein